MKSAKVGKRGAIVVPAKLRRRFGIEEGTVVTAEEREDGILIRPAVVVPIERHTPERKAEFLLSTATNAADYRRFDSDRPLHSFRHLRRNLIFHILPSTF
jgi:AbrB family looped-hinge helix DNA binding protein